MTTIRPQKGPQEAFLASKADIAIYGGAAGGGKTWALLLEPLRHISNPGFGAVIFRRMMPQITNEGGMWDQAGRLYPLLGAQANITNRFWRFRSGARIAFSHMQFDTDKNSWQGSQIPFIGWDELTHFTSSQFWYMLSRSRSTCGVKPYVRGTTNPDVASWVAELIAWWIDQNTGFPIPERAGVLRWFIRGENEEMVWADTPQEIVDQYPGSVPKSLTFVPAKLDDNPELVRADPGYLANLLALPKVERERLLNGNWLVRPMEGLFKREYFQTILDHRPPGGTWVRFWDLAVSIKRRADYTVGALVGRLDNGTTCVADIIRGKWEWPEAKKIIIATAQADGRDVEIGVEQAAMQLMAIQELITEKDLYLYRLRGIPPAGDKAARAALWSVKAEAGQVHLVRGLWVPPFLAEVCTFPNGVKDDQIDGVSGAVEMLGTGDAAAPVAGETRDLEQGLPRGMRVGRGRD